MFKPAIGLWRDIVAAVKRQLRRATRFLAPADTAIFEFDKTGPVNRKIAAIAGTVRALGIGDLAAATNVGLGSRAPFSRCPRRVPSALRRAIGRCPN
jgi:hypothetical protein